jgi:hypothetical protein
MGFKWIGPAFISSHFPLPFADWAQYGNWAGPPLLLFFSYSRWAQFVIHINPLLFLWAQTVCFLCIQLG